jgi:hypothetical protein
MAKIAALQRDQPLSHSVAEALAGDHDDASPLEP